jgi:hypothetical protein
MALIISSSADICWHMCHREKLVLDAKYAMKRKPNTHVLVVAAS